MIEKIAFYQGRNDEEPNILLAEDLAGKHDEAGIAEIVKGLEADEPQVAGDCIKVLYEIGYRKPELIAPYASTFVAGLKSRNNRIVWGSAIALSLIAEPASDYLFSELEAIQRAYESGSVITVDNCISIFAGIAKAKEAYRVKIFPLILDHLRTCRPKEVGQHAERAFSCVNGKYAAAFASVLRERYDSLAESQRKRVDKLLKRMDEAGR